MSLCHRDRALLWHPFSQEKRVDFNIPIQRGEGAYLYDENGKGYLDLISSWWVNLHGHGHPEIAQAIFEQAKTLEHVIFSSFTHEPAVQLCEKLYSQLPKSLARFFFSDNGSTSVEAALKMAYQYWWNKGEKQRTLFLSFSGGYHGDTFGAMSVGKGSSFHEPFQSLLFDVLMIPFPSTWHDDNELDQKEKNALLKLNETLEAHKDCIAGMIIEPLVQGAGGMAMCRPSFLNEVVKTVKKYDGLVIFDEVMTGFYRTGTLFALDQIDETPDFLCLSKGLTGGFLPLALTITTQTIYEAFLSDHFDKAFAHGHSHTANPLGCAAGITSLTLLLSQNVQNAIQKIQYTQQEGLNYLKETSPFLKNFRQCGTITAFDTDHKNFMPLLSPFDRNVLLKKIFLEKGLLLRPLGGTIYVLPPYCIRQNDLENVYPLIQKCLLEQSV